MPKVPSELTTFAIKLVTAKKHIFSYPIDSDKTIISLFQVLGLHLKAAEEFHVLFISSDGWVTGHQVIAMGTLTKMNIEVREVFKGAILANAHRILLAHNHPHGRIDPSPEDLELTENIVLAGEILGIPVVDHYIFSHEEVFIFSEHNLI